MKKYHPYCVKYIAVHILLLAFNAKLNANYPNIETLKSISIQNAKIKALRNDVSRSIYIVKSNKDSNLLPELRFYKYKVRKYDSFWRILSTTSLNIDTLATCNALSSPMDIYPGKEIYISNMRGIIYKTKRNESIDEIARKYKIDKKYIYNVNRINKGNKSHLFIPCAKISNLEKSLFMGVGFKFPLKRGKRTSNFGRRKDPFNNRNQFHSGIDIACPMRSRIYAARSGKVFFIGRKGGYGLLVIIKHPHNYYSYYGHLSKILVQKGKDIKRGSVIALSGNSGRTTGPHLHFEIRKGDKPINPGILLK
ncbi:MAG: LysM peptidoglycan-binding domain-containing M23 family metallopeptidase [Spirochaetota bacterium]|nr:LysM peptidoglycan-binding domain-containing M23 family metallopeptidase [Spirochaetota bacterium]